MKSSKFHFLCNKCKKQIPAVLNGEQRYLRLNPSEVVLCDKHVDVHNRDIKLTVEIVDKFDSGKIVLISDF